MFNKLKKILSIDSVKESIKEPIIDKNFKYEFNELYLKDNIEELKYEETIYEITIDNMIKNQKKEEENV